MNIETVNELITSLESAGELSIKERKYLEALKEFRLCSVSLNVAVKVANDFDRVIMECRKITGCPAGVDLQDHLRQLAAENAGLNAERVWEKTMMEVCGEDGPASVASEIRALQALRDTAMQALKSQVEQLAAENVALKAAITDHSQSVHFCEVCGKDDPCSTDDVCYALRETPATDRIVAGIKADAVKGIYSFNKVDCCVYLDGDVCMLIDAYEASLREGAK